MRRLQLPLLTVLTTVLLGIIMLGLSRSAVLYIITAIAAVLLARTHTIHFLLLMLISGIAYYELGRPYTDAFGFNFYLPDIFIIACIAYLIIVSFGFGIAKPSGTIMTTYKLFLLVFLLGAIHGLINGVELRNLMRDISGFGGYLTIPVALNAFRNEKQIYKFARLIMRIGILMAAIAIIMRVLGIENEIGFPGSGEVGTAFGRFSRAYGLSGGTSFMVAALFLLMSLSGMYLKTHFRDLAAKALIFAQLLLLFARSLFLGIASGFAVLFITSGSRITVSTLLLIVLAFMLIYVVSELIFEIDYIPAIADRYLSIVSERFGDEAALANIQRRENEFIGAWNELSWNERTIGLGVGSRIVVSVGEGKEVSGYHNSYATCIQQIGLIGLFVYMLFLFSTIREAIRVKHLPSTDRQLYGVGVGFLCGFIALAIWGSGAMGMPLNANVLACVSLGMVLRIFLILRKEGLAKYA